MNNQTIDTAIAKRLVKGHMIRGASIIGASGGWSVLLKVGTEEMPLVTQRTDRPRLWSSLDTCVSYLKGELSIHRFDMLDTTHHNKLAVVGKMRNDTAERMKRAHEAAAYDKWFREGVQAAIDDPRPSVLHDEVKARSRAAIQKVIDAKKASHTA
jgi:hypothetical protein